MEDDGPVRFSFGVRHVGIFTGEVPDHCDPSWFHSWGEIPQLGGGKPGLFASLAPQEAAAGP